MRAVDRIVLRMIELLTLRISIVRFSFGLIRKGMRQGVMRAANTERESDED